MRRAEREQRRQAVLRRRAGLATGAVLGATALLAGPAQAATYTVTTGADSGAGSLRDAFAQANVDATPDDITFDPSVTEIKLASELYVNNGTSMTIHGLGADDLTITGDADGDGTGDTRLFNVGRGANLGIEDVTLTKGRVAGAGGAILAQPTSSLLVQDSVLTGNLANTGGAIHAQGEVTYGYWRNGPSLIVRDSQVAGNQSIGGGGAIETQGSLLLEGSAVTNNVSGEVGGAVNAFGADVPTTVKDSVISGNTAVAGGGGVAIRPQGGKYASNNGQNVISGSTFDGNTTTGGDGGGLLVGTLQNAASLQISDSTFSGNSAPSAGGGIAAGTAGSVLGTVDVADTTIAGNHAGVGGGASFGGDTGWSVNPSDRVNVRNSTVSGNTATTRGGGIAVNDRMTGYQYNGYGYGYSYDYSASQIRLSSTIVADNLASGQPQDVDRPDRASSGGVSASYSLIETPGDGMAGAGTSNITGEDPKLGALGAHGGPTETQVPADDSPAIDQGTANSLATDQRGVARTNDEPGIANAADGTDIGSVEAADVTAPTVASVTRADASPTNAGSVDFTVTFSEPVTGVAAGDFALTKTGTADGSISGVSGSGDTYTVSVSGVTGQGTLRLDVADASAEDLAGNALDGGFTGGEEYAVDTVVPTVTAITRVGASPTNAGSVQFAVKFSEAVSGVAAGDFALTATGVSGASITGVSGSGDTYVVTVGTGSGDGLLRLDVASAPTIADAAGNAVAGPVTTGQSYVLDRTKPQIAVNQAGDQADPAGGSSVRFTLLPSETVTGLDASDIVLGGTAGADKATLDVDGTTYVVTVSGMKQDGTVTAAVAAGAAKDAAGNDSDASSSTDNTVAWAAEKPQAAALPRTNPVITLPLTCKRVPKLEGHTLAYARFVLALDGCTSPLSVDNPKTAYRARDLVVTKQAPKAGTPRWGTETVRVIVKRKRGAKRVR